MKRLFLLSECISGDYNGTEAITKIMEDRNTFLNEIGALELLGALQNPKIEKYGLPNVFLYGVWFGKYYGYTMTKFDGSLEDRWVKQNNTISEMSILLVTKRVVRKKIKKKKTIMFFR